MPRRNAIDLKFHVHEGLPQERPNVKMNRRGAIYQPNPIQQYKSSTEKIESLRKVELMETLENFNLISLTLSKKIGEELLYSKNI